MKHYCCNHPEEVAHYIAGGKFYGPCCKEIAYSRAKREVLRQDAGRVDDFQFRSPSRPRRDTAIHQAL